MSDAYFILLTTAASVGFLHTAIGIDHSLPFLILAKTRCWSLRRTLFLTCACGVAHLASSILIAGLGLLFGIAVSSLTSIEETRGSWAAWSLVGFGIVYSAIALFRLKQGRHHVENSTRGTAPHPAALPHEQLVPALLIIFALGPCEALLPLLTASGLTLNLFEAAMVTLCFSGATLLAMLGLVTAGYLGVAMVPSLRQGISRLQPHIHVFAGVALALSGLSIRLFGI